MDKKMFFALSSTDKRLVSTIYQAAMLSRENNISQEIINIIESCKDPDELMALLHENMLKFLFTLNL